MVPLTGIEPASYPPQGYTLSVELQGRSNFVLYELTRIKFLTNDLSDPLTFHFLCPNPLLNILLISF